MSNLAKMRKIARLVRSSKQALMNLIFRLRIGTVRNYWEERHRRLASHLSAVGHVQLPEEQNRLDYAFKREMLTSCLSSCLSDSVAGGRALDVGCGTGQMFPVLQRFGFAITGIDFSVSAIKQARASFPDARLLVADITSIKFREQFDMILIYDVLFHIIDHEHWSAALDALLQHLTPTGTIVIQEHLVQQGEYIGRKQHVHHRVRESYDKWAHAGGLRVAYECTYALPGQKTHKNLFAFKHLDT